MKQLMEKVVLTEGIKHFEKGTMWMYAKWNKAYKNFRTSKSMQAKEGQLFLEKD